MGKPTRSRDTDLAVAVIKTRMEDTGLTYAEIADAVGVSRQYVESWVNFRQTIPTQRVAAFAKALKLDEADVAALATGAVPAKRGPGRPRKDASNDDNGDEADDTPRRGAHEARIRKLERASGADDGLRKRVAKLERDLAKVWDFVR